MLLPNCKRGQFGGGGDFSITKLNVIAVIGAAIYTKTHAERKAYANRQAAEDTSDSADNWACRIIAYSTTNSSTSNGNQRCSDATRKAILFNSLTIKGVVT
ncbi:hypothetical protein [Endozoicomonas sp. GU-1]|uniref:hypothetical protein n=1 Tax=Endozoicomonas sp. GU-1 TaxID=3009078 RepID=UPI0022B4B621|nr:hypothetical protein [Endozoicomonas sp. GU-1]WBA80266.1 hypothetical protein O2T12_18265 [Endozoicomonas sp. GU-1]